MMLRCGPFLRPYAIQQGLISAKHIHILFPSFLAKLEKVCFHGSLKFIQLRTGYEQDLRRQFSDNRSYAAGSSEPHRQRTHSGEGGIP
ncbi:MAG TPA: hypothetical protein DGH25_00785 [Erwiniaceae bacterium]|uniref:Uncharacterized protein n=1 Tax=Mixta calida TaxID=665913 RepID=A0ABN5HBU0_9GAMM|nr:hypothetical protein C2E16_15100 [Mixta calida]POU50258.1 hypothetical protein C3380_06565 [Pantoea sp. PSNIH5]POU69080.1 hypothetical protein C3374_08060 [Pantoea sp. PSNIH4]POY66379.1 hypothetical protein C3402_18340 [Pantoea sp. PSNIH3]HCW45953.1 hypothetical protein [Erwiniaceae bacterium]